VDASAPSSGPPAAARILVVDDEKVIREILAEFLQLEGYQVATCEDGQKALDELRLRPYDLVISDLKMPRLSGLQLLEKIAEEGLNVLTVIMTGFGTVETAIEAMKRGAYDYVLKPFKVEEVIHVVQRGLYRQQLQAENIRLREALTIYQVSEALATSLDLDHILDTILKAAVKETGADVATLHLRDGKSGQYEERLKMVGDASAVQRAPTPSFDLLTERFDRGQTVVSHGESATRFFAGALGGADGRELVSFLSVPVQIGAYVQGVVNVYSFTRGKKFDEGHRKMLTVLSSRAATAIDNARLYEDLRLRNTELRAANQTLEDTFRSTVAGFAQALEETDLYTRGHSERVATYAELLGARPDAARRRGPAHRPGRRDARHRQAGRALRHAQQAGQAHGRGGRVFRQHPEKGKRILEPVPCLHGLIDGCWCHHEWWDGGGYPRGLSGTTSRWSAGSSRSPTPTTP
jgi:response regulator RpfG family c-di-GMP phosphodiesterase